MNNSRTWTARSVGVSTVLLIPVIVIFSVPLAIGIGLDIFSRIGEEPFALVLCIPIAFGLLRLVSPLARNLRPELRLRLPSTIRAH